MLIYKQVFLISAVFYLTLLLFVYLRQESFIFFPTQGKHQLSDESKNSITEYTFSHTGETLNGWLLNEAAAQNLLIIYYGGNAEDIFYSIAEFNNFDQSAVLFVNYRGYGTSSGKPGEKELFSDALAIIDDVHKRYSPQKTYLMGRSLGSGVAAYIASKREVDGVILVTPYDSIESLARRQFPFLPTTLLLKHKFRSIDYVEKITSPSLVIYGGRDTIVSPRSTEKLLAHFITTPETIFIKEGGHNNIEMFQEYKTALQSFILGH